GALIETLPLPQLRGHAELASAIVRQEQDGLVRRMPVKELTSSGELPSIAARLADASPDIGLPGIGTFEIDYGIRPASLPMVSYVDVLRGAFDLASIAGKDVIVGAVAIELGDTLPVPVWRNLPGPV